MISFFNWCKKKSEYEELYDDEENKNGFQNTFLPSKLAPYLSLYRFASPLDVFFHLVGILCTIVSAVCQPIYVILFGRACGYFISHAISISNPSLTANEKSAYNKILQGEIIDFAIVVTTMGAVNLILEYIAGVLWAQSSCRQVLRLRQDFLEKTLNQDINWFDVHQPSEFSSKFADSITKIEDGIGEKVTACLYHLVVFLTGIIFSLSMGWQLTMVCLVSLPASLIIMAVISKVAEVYYQDEIDSFASAASIAEEVFSAIRTVVAFGGQQKEVERFDAELQKTKSNNMGRILFNSTSEALLFFLMYACCGLAAWFGIHLIVEGRFLQSSDERFNPGNIVAIIYTTWMASWNFYMAIPFFHIFKMACTAGSNVFAIMDNVPKINISFKYGLRPIKCIGQITFSKVHFNYPSKSSISILNGVSLTIRPGETVAFVGAVGCGSSTCFELLQRFYDPTYGKIFIDGNNLKDLVLSWWRNQIGVVDRVPTLFDTTIYENIRFGDLDASQEDIERAVRKAGMNKFIRKLPKGYHTKIGEEGLRLSSELKWRLAIARAIVKNPSVLLIDATSRFSAGQVETTIDAVTRDYTSIIMTDSIYTVKNANRIYIFADGQIEGYGSYQELMDNQAIIFPLLKAKSNDESGMNQDELEEEGLSLDEKELESEVHLTNTQEHEPKKDNSSRRAGIFDVLRLNSPEWPWIVIGSLCWIIIGISMPISIILIAEVIGNMYIQNSNNLLQVTEPLCWQLFLLGVVCGSAYLLKNYSFGIAGEKLTFRLRSNMFSSIIEQNIGWFDKDENSVEAIGATLSGDAAVIALTSEMLIGLIFNTLATVVVSSIISSCLEIKLALILGLFIPIVISISFSKFKMDSRTIESRERMLKNSNAIADEAINKVRSVQSLGCEEVFLSSYADVLKPHMGLFCKNSHLWSFYSGIAKNLMAFSYAVGLLYGTLLVINEDITYKTVVKVTELQIYGSWAIWQGFAFVSNLKIGMDTAQRVFEILKTPAIPRNLKICRKEWKIESIQLSDVHFSQPNKPLFPILRGVNLKILAGKTVALVGSRRCGRSIFELLAQFYNVLDGEITVNDVDISMMDPKYLRTNFAIISQECDLFDRTIAENISYGANHKVVSEQEIVRAARNANIHNFVISLPLGYETRIGSRGSALSHSQKLRIAIARALVRNPSVLFLDEPTAALDKDNACIVQDALCKAKRNRACIISTNFPKTVEDADLICLFHKGRIVEMGSHEELLGRMGYYHNLYMEQSCL